MPFLPIQLYLSCVLRSERDSSGESSDDDEDEEGDDDTDFARVGSADRYLMGLPQALRLLDDHPEGHMKDTLEALSGADGLTTVGQAPLCGGMSCVPTVTNLNHASVVAGNSRVVRVASFSQAHVGDCFPKSPNMKENKREMVAAVKILAQLLSDGDVRLVNLFMYRLVVDVAKTVRLSGRTLACPFRRNSSSCLLCTCLRMPVLVVLV